MKNSSSRQSFLGRDSQRVIEAATIGVVGLGGGGSQIVQALAHIGFLNYVLVDPDSIEDHNLNRLVGGTQFATESAAPKVEIAKNLVIGIRPHARVAVHQSRWQDCAIALRRCDVLFSAMDGFSQRRQLEALARRYMIPLLDIGMDVSWVDPEPPQMAGQVILSMPGFACMQCMGFLSEKTLSAEAALYGDAGPRPQVVWTNGILANAAVGIAVDLLTDWTRSLRLPHYLSLRANNLTLTPHPRVPYLDMRSCPHYKLEEVGPPKLTSLRSSN